MELEEQNKEILENIKEYMQGSIDRGYHKFIYNDLDWDFKCIDAINAIDDLLNHLTKQDKMIELMALAISSYDGQLVINQYKDRNDVKAKFEEYVEDGTYEQYFKKKAEEEAE